MIRLPIGIQDFKEIRTNNFLYIDKTQELSKLLEWGKYYFLSRPRRFGKSLLISTLSELFQGNKELFKNLWIEDNWDWNQHYPVIEFKFNNAAFKEIGLKAYLSNAIREQANRYNLTLTSQSYPDQFKELITELYQLHGNVVVLIDEYDKPIIDFLHDTDQAKTNRDILKGFYSVLKPLDPYLRFVFLTGVSKFSRVSIFSDLNNLNDITLDPNYATLCGYTQQELEYSFKSFIEDYGDEKQERLAKIKAWYNGYSWDGENFVYNPFSILNYFSKNRFQNFWFSTGTPTLLVNTLMDNLRFNLEKLVVDEYGLEGFRLGDITPETLLFQTGYLTIKEIDEFGLYHLSYPNQEVKQSLVNYLLGGYSSIQTGHVTPAIIAVRSAFYQHDMEELIGQFNLLFSRIPYQIFIAQKEAYYHSVIFLTLHLLGYYTQAEVSHHKGRLDAVVQTDSAIYILEFKLDASASNALAQIKEKGYATPYLNGNTPVYLLGINFSSESKDISDWKIEEAVSS